MSLVIFCLLFSFVDYVPVKGEIIYTMEPPALSVFVIALGDSLSQHARPQHIASIFFTSVFTHRKEGKSAHTDRKAISTQCGFLKGEQFYNKVTKEWNPLPHIF